MTKKYQILSPDGIPSQTTFTSLKKAKEAIKVFVDAYKQQGYYSQTCSNGYVRHISLAELSDYCEIITI